MNTGTRKNKPCFPEGVLNPELSIGFLVSVSPESVRFKLREGGKYSGTHFRGGRYGKGEVGEFVLIEGQTNILLGRTTEIYLPEAERRTIISPNLENSKISAGGKIQLLGTVSMDNLIVTKGVDSYPRLGDLIYAAPHRFIADLPALMEPESERDDDVLIELGVIEEANESVVAIKPEKLLGRHCAILGTTGGGKSWTTARLIEECLQFNAKIILVDATGEYRNFSGKNIKHVYLGTPAYEPKYSKANSLPATSFTESDFMTLFDPAGKVQGPKLKAAIRSLRLASIFPAITENGIIIKINQSKSEFQQAEQKPGVAEKIEKPTQEFDVSKLANQIEQECVFSDAFKNGPGVPKGTKDPAKWGGETGEFSHCVTLVTRINAILTSSSFECIFKSKEPSLTKSIDKFIDNNNKNLFRICLSGVSHEFNAREIVANVIGRYLLNKARNSDFLEKPLVVVVDEAHHFLGRHIGSEDTYVKLDAFELIAKEGRKFGLNICLATQRPRDITDGVLSQMGTFIVHRLINDQDRKTVERACGDIDGSVSPFIPDLQSGQAVIIGTDVPIPLTIKITPPHAKPESRGADFQKNWKI